MTSQGHPYAIFRRALKAGDLLTAEMVARAELAQVSLEDALSLTILIAQKDPRRHTRAGARWLRRYLDVTTDPTLEDVALVTSCLAALAGPQHEHAVLTLQAVAEQASGARHRRRVA